MARNIRIGRDVVDTAPLATRSELTAWAQQARATLPGASDRDLKPRMPVQKLWDDLEYRFLLTALIRKNSSDWASSSPPSTPEASSVAPQDAATSRGDTLRSVLYFWTLKPTTDAEGDILGWYWRTVFMDEWVLMEQVDYHIDDAYRYVVQSDAPDSLDNYVTTYSEDGWFRMGLRVQQRRRGWWGDITYDRGESWHPVYYSLQSQEDAWAALLVLFPEGIVHDPNNAIDAMDWMEDEAPSQSFSVVITGMQRHSNLELQVRGVEPHGDFTAYVEVQSEDPLPFLTEAASTGQELDYALFSLSPRTYRVVEASVLPDIPDTHPIPRVDADALPSDVRTAIHNYRRIPSRTPMVQPVGPATPTPAVPAPDAGGNGAVYFSAANGPHPDPMLMMWLDRLDYARDHELTLYRGGSCSSQPIWIFAEGRDESRDNHLAQNNDYTRFWPPLGDCPWGLLPRAKMNSVLLISDTPYALVHAAGGAPYLARLSWLRGLRTPDPEAVQSPLRHESSRCCWELRLSTEHITPYLGLPIRTPEDIDANRRVRLRVLDFLAEQPPVAEGYYLDLVRIIASPNSVVPQGQFTSEELEYMWRFRLADTEVAAPEGTSEDTPENISENISEDAPVAVPSLRIITGAESHTLYDGGIARRPWWEYRGTRYGTEQEARQARIADMTAQLSEASSPDTEPLGVVAATQAQDCLTGNRVSMDVVTPVPDYVALRPETTHQDTPSPSSFGAARRNDTEPQQQPLGQRLPQSPHYGTGSSRQIRDAVFDRSQTDVVVGFPDYQPATRVGDDPGTVTYPGYVYRGYRVSPGQRRVQQVYTSPIYPSYATALIESNRDARAGPLIERARNHVGLQTRSRPPIVTWPRPVTIGEYVCHLVADGQILDDTSRYSHMNAALLEAAVRWRGAEIRPPTHLIDAGETVAFGPIELTSTTLVDWLHGYYVLVLRDGSFSMAIGPYGSRVYAAVMAPPELLPLRQDLGDDILAAIEEFQYWPNDPDTGSDDANHDSEIPF